MSILRSTLPDLTLNIDEFRELLFRGFISWYGPSRYFLHYCGGARVNADDESAKVLVRRSYFGWRPVNLNRI